MDSTMNLGTRDLLKSGSFFVRARTGVAQRHVAPAPVRHRATRPIGTEVPAAHRMRTSATEP